MYCKRVLILEQSNNRFAQYGKQLCGMVKAVNESTNTNITVFVTNADIKTEGQWWLLLNFGGKVFSKALPNLNNFVFSLPQQSLETLGCILAKRETKTYLVAKGFLGASNLCDNLIAQMESLTTDNATNYEQFVASTNNFYPNGISVNVQELTQSASERYKSVKEYSQAFERYYASGGTSNYYQTVQKEIAKVFLQFPPYYPLINRYKSSFFVRVDFPSSEKYFVIGVLQKEGIVKYICYGLPDEKQKVEDKDFVLVENQPTSFWMIFQDADTGFITKLDGV